VVIDIVNVLRSVVKTENDPPIGANGYCPESFPFALERMQPESWKIHVADSWGGVKRRQYVSQFANVFRVNSARVVVFKKSFQSFVAQ
jgi:hypothetical protein